MKKRRGHWSKVKRKAVTIKITAHYFTKTRTATRISRISAPTIVGSIYPMHRPTHDFSLPRVTSLPIPFFIITPSPPHHNHSSFVEDCEPLFQECFHIIKITRNKLFFNIDFNNCNHNNIQQFYFFFILKN